MTRILFLMLIATWGLGACKPNAGEKTGNSESPSIVLDTFADLQILYYDLPGWDELSLRQKTLIYYLSEAALAGRDIIYDQNCKHNLAVRKTIEGIYSAYKGERKGAEWAAFETWAKRVWFSNGIHHHYNENKLAPEFSQAYFVQLIQNTPTEALPLLPNETHNVLISKLTPVLFDAEFLAKRTSKEEGEDVVSASAVSFYENVSAEFVNDYYRERIKAAGPNAPLIGLNSKLYKSFIATVELVWRSGAGNMYGTAIEKIVENLEKAIPFAENEQQKETIERLVEYYRTGDLRKFDEYNIAWVKDTAGKVDFINGFIEVYRDPLGYKGTWEAVVQYDDPDASAQMRVISQNAQYFEDNSPIQDQYKKKEVKGVSYRVINVAMEGGDCAPSTPIGINLPNSNWIREQYGSKSISLNNIENAYAKTGGAAATAEFAHDDDEIELSKKYGELCHKMHTALHEVIGHASGQLKPGMPEPNVTLKQYSSTLEEARADLVALYFMPDAKLIEWKLMPNAEAYKASYDYYIRNGLLQQLRRLQPGQNIEEDHMRNRQLVAAWAFEKGQKDGVIARVERNGKTYYDIRDYDKLRDLFGQLLREIQRIKSEGDFAAAKALVEGYGVKADQAIVQQVRERYAKLPTKPYSGFVQPKLVAIRDKDGKITDVKVEREFNFVQQMLRYGKEYAFLPIYN
ncbi:MAG: dipeptidyl-peptidase 3 family protein [Saprospiraceae bacterium]